MPSRSVKYQADGLSMDAELFYEAGSGRKPGVLVFPEAFGLGEHALEKARQLSQLGYVALACDLHGNRRLFDNIPDMQKEFGPLMADPKRPRLRAQGALDALSACPEVDTGRIAAIGFCFGGTLALELARSGAPIAAAVGFHSGLGTASTADAKNIRGKVLVCIGADDPMIPIEQRAAFEKEMREGKVDWQLNVYGGATHSFTNKEADARGNPQSFRYDAKVEARSWQQMRELFSEAFA
jgi:dienelactone hydrolase